MLVGETLSEAVSCSLRARPPVRLRWTQAGWLHCSGRVLCKEATLAFGNPPSYFRLFNPHRGFFFSPPQLRSLNTQRRGANYVTSDGTRLTTCIVCTGHCSGFNSFPRGSADSGTPGGWSLIPLRPKQQNLNGASTLWPAGRLSNVWSWRTCVCPRKDTVPPIH